MFEICLVSRPGADRPGTKLQGGLNTVIGNDVEKNKSVDDLITELRQRTAELEDANRELRRLSHYRSLFLARMSHELRTPLTSILGFSEILLDQEELTDTQRRFCQKVQDSGFQLQASLNQLVDLSRLEAGQTEVFLQEFSLRETLRESCAAAARMAQKREVKIEYELAPEITTVVSDQGKFRQIVFNFIAWAVGRSPIGDAVKITATLNQPAQLQLEMTDNGEPVPEMEQPQLHGPKGQVSGAPGFACSGPSGTTTLVSSNQTRRTRPGHPTAAAARPPRSGRQARSRVGRSRR